ncbi:MAG: hypothetical protein KJ737_27415, partial [Proteobacteria bacterium]|nr:hypothetical protein [Pseudomonadota bacterium]
SGLCLKDSIDYIIKRLKWAGISEPLFTDDAYSAIHEISYGIPRLIGNGKEGLVTNVALNKSAIRRLWWFVGAIASGIFGVAFYFIQAGVK